MKHTLSASLLKQLTILKSQNSRHTVYLIGTAHVSEKSSESVRELIGIIKPKAVFLELCDLRRSIIEVSANDAEVVEMSFFDELDSLRTGKTNLFGLIYKRALRKASSDIGVESGGEFKAAYEAAQACGATVVLGDRNVGITLKRVWQGLSFFEKASFAAALAIPLLLKPSKAAVIKSIEDTKEVDYKVLDVILETGKTSSWLVESILFERDLYMLYRLFETIESFDEEDSCDIVAVVGAAHVYGISQRWNMEIKYPGSELSEENILDVLKTPGSAINEEHISVSDLR